MMSHGGFMKVGGESTLKHMLGRNQVLNTRHVDPPHTDAHLCPPHHT